MANTPSRGHNIPHQNILEMFEYRDGKLFWRVRPLSHFANNIGQGMFNARYAGSEAGQFTKHGYRVVSVRYEGITKMISAHRIVWFMHKGFWPDEVDHINQTKADNRIENLREATRSTNCQNRPQGKGPTKSGYIGVFKHNSRYRAKINVNRKQILLGSHATPREAALVYDDAARMHFGDNAYTNKKAGLLNVG